MAKLTKAQRTTLLSALSALERAQRLIANPSVAFCRFSDNATTTLHYTRTFVDGIDKPGDARPLTVMAKDIGTELCLIPQAIRDLQRVLEAV